jgi:Mg-chelatase subunit ChlD
VTGDKRAAPGLVRLGESVQVELSLDIECRPGTQQRADIVLILDRSNSMAGDKLNAAVVAASRFVQGLDLTRHRVGLVSFSDVVSLDEGLTADEVALLNTLARTRADGRTDIAGALERALLHLGEEGRPEAQQVMLLLTDGNPSRPGQPYVDAVRMGARGRARGALTFAIGLGEDVDDSLLTAVVGQADRYFFAPNASDLDPIYDQISATVGEVVATDLVVTDQMGADVRYTPASAQPPAAGETLDTVTWTAAAVPASGLRFTVQVIPQRLGLLPTNTMAMAEYTADGQRYSFTFPIPEVQVVEAPTPSPSSPGTVYLPLLMQQLCLPKDRALGVDVVLIIDTSSSMEGEKLEAAVAAAGAFLDAVDANRDRVGLVSFDSEGRREYLITADLPALRQRLAQLQTGQGTRIDLGMEAALSLIDAWGRKQTPKVIVLLSDGRPQGGSEDATLGFAEEARRRGHTVFTVGLGTDLDADYMRAIAGAFDRFYAAPKPGALAGVYERIAGALPCR